MSIYFTENFFTVSIWLLKVLKLVLFFNQKEGFLYRDEADVQPTSKIV